MSKNHKKRCRAIVPGMIPCEKSPLPGKGYCAEHEKEFSCVQCKQEIREKGVSISVGDKYVRQEETDEKRNLCWGCWEKEKDNWIEKFRAEEVSVVVHLYDKNSGELSASIFPKVCPTCRGWYLESKFNDTCSASCQKQYDNLSSQEKESLKTSTQSPSKSSQLQERERERERERAIPSPIICLGF